jgi:hypothetical protein
MFKKVLILLVIPLALGCSDSKKASQKKTNEIKWEIRTEQSRKNMTREDVLLLATKYEISEDQLTEILIDYEKMTQIFSMTEVLKAVTGKDKPKLSVEEELVDVSTALNRISEKYGISKKTLSTIILERKMVAVSSKD